MQLHRVRSLFSLGTRSRSSRGDPTPLPALPHSISVEYHQMLLDLLNRYLYYFIHNQYGADGGPVSGCVRDSRRPGRPPQGEKISTAATGMGFMAIALASSPDCGLLTREDSITRVARGIETALCLPSERGMTRHFLEVDGTTKDWDAISTIDSGWLIAGALWAAEYLGSEMLQALANELYDRVDWRYWTHGHPDNLLRHGRHIDGSLLHTPWDHFNGETLLLYVLGTGAKDSVALPVTVWRSLQLFPEDDLGLFTTQMGLELFAAEEHLTTYTGTNLLERARIAVDSHIVAAGGNLWGYSAGECPTGPDGESCYKEVSPGHSDGTVNTNVVVASLRANSAAVLANVSQAVKFASSVGLMGRYGVPNMKMEAEAWSFAPSAVAIDLGIGALAIRNFLNGEEVRTIFHRLPFVQRAIERINAA